MKKEGRNNFLFLSKKGGIFFFFSLTSSTQRSVCGLLGSGLEVHVDNGSGSGSLFFHSWKRGGDLAEEGLDVEIGLGAGFDEQDVQLLRSEERRVGKECRS